MDDFEKEWCAPWESRRGLGPGGGNADDLQEVLLRAPVEAVASVLAALGGKWSPEVVGDEVVVGRGFAFVFRLQGHAWTGIVSNVGDISEVRFVEELSRRLACDALMLVMWRGDAEYWHFKDGVRVEHLRTENGAIAESDPASSWEGDAPAVSQVADALLRRQDAYAAGFSDRYFFSDGSTLPYVEESDHLEVRNPGVVLMVRGKELRGLPQFERVDYVAF